MGEAQAKPRETRTIVAGRAMPDFKRIRVAPITGAAGCEIEGLDLCRPLDDEIRAEVMAAFEHFLVILFRGQKLSLEEHKEFGRQFGALMELPQAPIVPGHPDMQELRREAHEPVSVVPFTRFHTDSPFLKRPPLCVVMRALDVPLYGGDTAFANMHLAYEGLSEGLKKTLAALKCVYSGKDIWSRNEDLDPDKRLRLRDGHSFREEELEHVHPVVRSHPTTGRKALYVTSAYFKRFEGWSEEDSRPLMEYLQAQAYKLQVQTRVRWAPDTLIVWDNRFVQHCGVHDYENERRHMVRCTVIGEAPI